MTATEDDLDKEQIDQLHEATLKMSDSCFELKKLCATVLAPTITLVLIVTGRSLDAAIFLVGLIVVVGFWLADAVGYFYQRKTRAGMVLIWKRRAERLNPHYDHYPKTKAVSWWKAAFNWSMMYYAILAVLLLLGLLLFAVGALHGNSAP